MASTPNRLHQLGEVKELKRHSGRLCLLRMKGLLLLLGLVLVVRGQTNTGCEESNRWCSNAYECASQALCFVCQLLGGSGTGHPFGDTQPSQPFPTDSFCLSACGIFSDGFALQKTPDFPLCPQYYCAAYRSSSSDATLNVTCQRSYYNNLPSDTNAWYSAQDTQDWPFITPFQSLPECLFSSLTSPSWCNRFGVDAMLQTVWNLAQMVAMNS